MHHTLCDFLADLFQNAVEAGARHISLDLIQSPKDLVLRLQDDGRGMDEEELRRARDPFYTDGVKHPHRKVGLGLPFVIQQVNLTGGRFEIESKKGQGTRLEVSFPLDHWDTPPLGDLSGTLAQMLSLSGDFDCTLNRSLSGEKGEGSWQVTRGELLEALGSFEDIQGLKLLQDFFKSGEEELKQNYGG